MDNRHCPMYPTRRCFCPPPVDYQAFCIEMAKSYHRPIPPEVQKYADELRLTDDKHG